MATGNDTIASASDDRNTEFDKFETGITDAGNETIDTGTENIAADPAAGVVKKKRGRKSNAERARLAADGNPQYTIGGATPEPAKSAKNEKGQGLGVDSLARQLEGLHVMAAMVLKNETLVITSAESKQLATALIDVAALYSVNLSPQALAWGKLALTGVAIYAPKIVLSRAKRAANSPKVEKQAQAPATVTPISRPLDPSHPDFWKSAQ